MHLEKLLSISWKGLLNNKMRSLLTMLGVIIGVAAVIVMVSISAGTEKTIEEQISKLGTNLLFIQQNFGRGGPGGQSSSTGLVYSDADALEEHISGISGVVVEQSSTEQVKYGSVTITDVEILGSSPNLPDVRDMTVASGRYINKNDVDRKLKVAVLGASLANKLFSGENPIGQSVTVGKYKLTVIGVFDRKGIVGNTDFDARLYTPISVVLEKFTPSFFARVMGDRVRMITVKLADDANLETVTSQINHLLARRHNVGMSELDFTILTQDDVISSQEATTAAFRNLLGWVAGVSLIVGGIGIMNIMLVSVTERTREIGIRQAVGASPSDIRRQFLAEALMLSLVGGLIGVFVGVGGSWLFGLLGGMRTVVVPVSVLLAFASSAAVGIIFGYFPADKASQLDPIEALRHE